MPDLPESDDELARILRSALAGTSPHESDPPESVKAGSYWIHDFLNMDGAIAEAAEADASSLGARSLDTRILLFEFSTHDIEIRVVPTVANGRVLEGLVAPAVVGRVTGAVAGRAVEVDLAPDGSFVIETAAAAGECLLALTSNRAMLRLEPFLL